MDLSNKNPLLSEQTASGSSFQVALHPLALLTISDYITRHELRQMKGPIVGALLGQQTGRSITIEHAFECQTAVSGPGIILDEEWFRTRLAQMVLVHKDRDLELVGWFTTLPSSGPIPAIVPIHKQILHKHNESAILLGFHLDEVDEAVSGSKLPITLYESNYELGDEADEATAAQGDSTEGQADEDKVMRDFEPQLKPMFREIPYVIETLEAEMIGLDHVATGAADATLDSDDERTAPAGKGKGRAVVGGGQDGDEQEELMLSAEDGELIAALRTKSNAVKMLQSRIKLLVAYLESLPPSYLTNPQAPLGMSTMGSDAEPENNPSLPSSPSYPILLSIQALVSRLALLDPAASPSADDLGREILAEANDARIIELLNLVVERAGDVQDLGARFGVVEASKSAAATPLATASGAGGVGGLRRGNTQESFSAAGDLLS